MGPVITTYRSNMADAAPADRGGFRGGFGGRGRGRGRGRGGRGGRGRGRGKEEKEWVPITKLGRLVKDGKIKSLEQIYLYSLPIKEFEIIDFFLGPSLKDEVLKIMPVQKQTRAGQRTRFKAFVAIGDYDGQVGLVFVQLIPAPRGTGIVSAPVPKKLLQMGGVGDCYTSARGQTSTLGNFAKATYTAISKTYAFLTPDLWKETVFTKAPFEEFTDYLAKHHSSLGRGAIAAK